MFKGELEDVPLFKDAIQAISTLINEGVFKIKQDGISLISTDPTMVTLVDFKLSKNTFKTYEFEKEEEIGLNIEDLNSILKRAKASDSIILEVEDSKFSVTLKGETTRKFSLPILNIETQIPDIGSLEFSTSLDVKTSALSTGIGDASVVGETITFRTTENGLILESKGESSDVKFTIDKENGLILDISGPSVKSTFSLSYLVKIMKAEKLSDVVKIRLGNDFPMKIEFKVPEKCELEFVLAPRIEEE